MQIFTRTPSILITLIASSTLFCQPPTKIQKPDFYIGKFTLNMHKKDVRAILGKPSKIRIDKTSLFDGKIHYLYYYKDFTFNFADDELCVIECRSTSLATPKGVRVGDDICKVEKTYGNGEISKNGSEISIRFNLDKTDCYLTFHSKDNYIDLISLWFDYA